MKKIKNKISNEDSLKIIISELDSIIESIGVHYTNNTNLLHDNKDGQINILASLSNIEYDIASIYGKLIDMRIISLSTGVAIPNTYVGSKLQDNVKTGSFVAGEVGGVAGIASALAKKGALSVLIPLDAIPGLDIITGFATTLTVGLATLDYEKSKPHPRRAPDSYGYDIDIASGFYTAATKEEIPEAVIAKKHSYELQAYRDGNFSNFKTLDDFINFYLNLSINKDLKAEVEKEQKNFVPPKPTQLTVAIGGNGTVANTASILSQMPSSSTIEPDISAIKASVESISLNTGNLVNEYLEFLNNLDMVVLVPEQVKNSFDDFTKNITDLFNKAKNLFATATHIITFFKFSHLLY